MTYFTYNSRSSADFGLHIEKKHRSTMRSSSPFPAEAVTSSIRTAALPTSR